MKTETVLAVLSLLAGVAAAYWTYRSMRGAAPLAGGMYHAALNPYGWVYLPAANQYQRVTPSGAVITENVLVS